MAAELDESHKVLRGLCDDVLARNNVWKMNGEDELDAAFKEMRVKLPDDDYWSLKVEHARKCAHSLVFDRDIDYELLEQIKTKIQTESKEAYAKNAAKLKEEEDASSSGEEDGPKMMAVPNPKDF